MSTAVRANESPPTELHEAPGTLMLRTQELLRAREDTILDIHKASGLPFYWLRRFKLGTITDPSVNKVQKLYEFLSGQPLKL